jgi:hypothetical protein
VNGVLANGASCIIMVGMVEEALALRAEGIGDICRGEIGGKPPTPYRPNFLNERGISRSF